MAFINTNIGCLRAITIQQMRLHSWQCSSMKHTKESARLPCLMNQVMLPLIRVSSSHAHC